MTTKQFFDYYDLEAYLGGRREAREYDTVAISEEVSHVDPTDGNRYWKPEVDEDTLFKIAERHHTGRRFLKEELEERIKPWVDAGVLAVENESSALFTVSSLLGGLRAGTILLTGGYISEGYGSMGTSNNPDYPKKVELMTKITLRAIEIIDKLDDLKDVREL